MASGCGLVTFKSSVSGGIVTDNAGPAPTTPPTYKIGTLADASKVAKSMSSNNVGRKIYVQTNSYAREGVLQGVESHLIIVKLSNGHVYREELENINEIWVLK
jgi:hypothetical protein